MELDRPCAMEKTYPVDLCEVQNCSRPRTCKTFCMAHYMRLKKNPNTDLLQPIRPSGWRHQSTAERFWSKVNKKGPIPSHCPALGSCWVWTASCKRKGYGQFRIHSQYYLAHRIAWELSYGNLSSMVLLCHHCDNPPCVRPSHCFLGTHKENSEDRERKARHPHLPVRVLYGSRHPHAILDEERVREIRKRWADGEGQQSLASCFGVSDSTISAVVCQKSWKHVTY